MANASEHARIESFLGCTSFAVVGASQNRAKYGNKVLRAYMQANLEVAPVHPTAETIEGLSCFEDVRRLSEARPDTALIGVSIVTPPVVTEAVLRQGAESGIRHYWLQPGAESPTVLQVAEELGLSIIAGGPCILVQLRFRESV